MLEEEALKERMTSLRKMQRSASSTSKGSADTETTARTSTSKRTSSIASGVLITRAITKQKGEEDATFNNSIPQRNRRR